MAIDPIPLYRYPLDNSQSVFSGEEYTALELAGKTAQKMNEVVQVANGIEMNAIESRAIVDDMKQEQENFVLENSNIRDQMIANQEQLANDLTSQNQVHIDGLKESKDQFENSMNEAVQGIIDNSETLINENVTSKIDGLINDGTINNLINEEILGNVNEGIDNLNLASSESTGYGIITGLNVLPQSNPNMSVLVASGIAHLINGKRYNQNDNVSINVDPADPLFPRIDIIYIDSNGLLKYGKGSASQNPVAPNPINSLILCEISITQSTLKIQNSNIVDKRIFKTKIADLESAIKESDKKTSGYISLKSYCVGGGVVDDTQGFLNALSYAKSKKLGIFVDDKYLIKQGIIIEDDTIPEIFGSNKTTCSLIFDIENGIAIETQSYYTKSIKISNITIRSKDRSKLVNGIKATCPFVWGSGIILNNVDLLDFKGVTFETIEPFNQQFNNVRFVGDVTGQTKESTLIKIGRISNFGSVLNFTNCVLQFGKIGIMNKGASGLNFTNCTFESLTLFHNMSQVPGLSMFENFDNCWFEEITTGIINADINESTLALITPTTNKASILRLSFKGNVISSGVASPFLNNVVEPYYYNDFSVSNGLINSNMAKVYKSSKTTSNGMENTVASLRLINSYIDISSMAYTPTGALKYGTVIIYVEASGYLGRKMRGLFITSNYKTDVALQGTISDVDSIGSDYKIKGTWSDNLTINMQAYGQGLTDVIAKVTFIEE